MPNALLNAHKLPLHRRGSIYSQGRGSLPHLKQFPHPVQRHIVVVLVPACEVITTRRRQYQRFMRSPWQRMQYQRFMRDSVHFQSFWYGLAHRAVSGAREAYWRPGNIPCCKLNEPQLTLSTPTRLCEQTSGSRSVTVCSVPSVKTLWSARSQVRPGQQMHRPLSARILLTLRCAVSMSAADSNGFTSRGSRFNLGRGRQGAHLTACYHVAGMSCVL